jgi:hypothetical protein
MEIFYNSLKRAAAIAVCGAVVLSGTIQLARAQAAEKKYKDQGEFDIYNEVTKDLMANNAQGFTKALTDIDTWKQKYPESDFKDARTELQLMAYSGAKQWGKAVDIGGELINRNLDTVFSDPKSGPQDILKVLFTTTVSIQQMIQSGGSPTPEQLAIGEKAAKQLLDFNKKPEGTADAAWAEARNQLQAAAKAALLQIAVYPGDAALKKTPPDCATAQAAFSKALQEYPDQSFLAYNLGRAYNCAARAEPAKSAELAPKAIYEFVRAAAIDPSLNKTTDPKKITDYAETAYKTYHGGDDGLAELKDKVKASPLPPADFTIETATAVATRKQNEFKEKYPQLALWLGIKSQLADANTGTQYFEGQLKNAAVPPLKGTVVEGKPACRSKEILVAVPLPDQQGTPTAEISLKLDAPLTGKPEAGEIQFEGVPTAFTQSPFLLTMDTEKAKIQGLKVAACAAAPTHTAPKKTTTKKK